MQDDFEDLYGVDDLDDRELYDLIMQEFTDEPELDPDELDVQVEDGFVTVSGRVGTEQELQQIEQILDDVIGLSDYSNEVVLDEIVRAEQSAAADEAVMEEQEVEAQTGEEGDVTEPTADHLLEDLDGELYGTHDLQKAIEQGESYNAPDHPLQQGSWSEENH